MSRVQNTSKSAVEGIQIRVKESVPKDFGALISYRNTDWPCSFRLRPLDNDGSIV